MILVVVAALLVAAVFGWFALRDRITAEGEVAARACVEGPATVTVTADPHIADAVTAIAASWDATEPVVRDHCITTTVVASTAPEPDTALWIPVSSDAASAVLSDAARIQGPPRSFAQSPVVLATAPALTDVLGAAAVGWADLPALASGPGSLDAIGAPGWGSLRPALPVGPASEATPAALGAIAAATVASPAAVTAEQAASAPVIEAVSTLSLAATAASPTPPTNTDAALTAIADAVDPATAPVHAVPVTEQQVYEAVAAGRSVAAFRPAGSTPVADHPAILLTGVDDVGSAAAAALLDFSRGTDQQAVLTAAGFRVAGADGTETTPSPVGTLTFPAVGSPLPALSSAAATSLLGTLASPVRPSSTTVLLDVSGSMESTDGGATRLANVTGALSGAIDRLPDSTRVGMWVYSRALDGTRPYRVISDLGDLTADRRTSITSGLAALEPETATSTYASVRAAYDAAVAAWTPNGPQSVLLVTDGPNDDTSVSASSFLAGIDEASDPARPVRIDVISLTDNSDIDTLRTLAAQTGGQVIETPSSDPGLTGTLERSMSAS